MEEGEFAEIDPFTEVVFGHNEIAGALNTQAERVSDLHQVLPNTPPAVKEQLWRITLSSEDHQNPSELLFDLDEVERSVAVQIRTGVDRNHIVFEGHFKDIERVETRGGFGICFTTKKGTSIYLTPGKAHISGQ